MAAAKDSFDVAELLIRSGADVNANSNVSNISFQYLLHQFLQFDHFRMLPPNGPIVYELSRDFLNHICSYFI